MGLTWVCRGDRWGRRRSRGRGGSVTRGRSGRGSGRRRSFWGSGQSLEGAEGVGGGDQGDVVVPPAPGAALEVGQAERMFHLAIVVLDAPAELRQPHECGQRCVRGEVREPELDRFGLFGRPLGQQPGRRPWRGYSRRGRAPDSRDRRTAQGTTSLAGRGQGFSRPRVRTRGNDHIVGLFSAARR